MAKDTKSAAVDRLKQFGHDIEDPEGAHVRMKNGVVRDKFKPVDGGFHYFRVETVMDPTTGEVSSAWVQKVHHGDDYLWPEAHVAHVYQAAVDPDYHDTVATSMRWDVEQGKLVDREPATEN